MTLDHPVSDAPLIVNKHDLASLLDCSEKTVNALIERYSDFPIVVRGRNGVEWQFDVAMVTDFLTVKREAELHESARRKELFEQFHLPLPESASVVAGGITPSQRLALARALRQERELAIETRFLIRVDDLRPHLHSAAARLGRFLDGLPSQLGKQFGLSDDTVRMMRRALDDERRQFVREVRRALETEDLHDDVAL